MPTDVTGTVTSDGSIELKWSAANGAKAYVTHYADANVTDAKQAVYMGYATGTDWSLAADKVPAHKLGDTITLYVQSFARVGTGADDIAKAADLNSNAKGTAWSAAVTVEFKPTDANTIAEITEYLDAKQIDHTGKTAKADLLALVK